jgi:hypothetical protein
MIKDIKDIKNIIWVKKPKSMPRYITDNEPLDAGLIKLLKLLEKN